MAESVGLGFRFGLGSYPALRIASPPPPPINIHLTIAPSSSSMTSHPLHLRPSFATNHLEPPPPSPSPTSLPTSYITFCHPGYAGPANILFRLPTYDACGSHSSSTNDAPDTEHANLVWGVQHGIAAQACSIIACNLDGVLSSTVIQLGPGERPGLLPDTMDWDSLLTAKVYYFYPRAWFTSGSDKDLVYPVCPSFRDWQFPHELLPRQWLDVYVRFKCLSSPSPS